MERIVIVVAAVALGLVLVKTLPDLGRYIKIRQM
jgi:hypothetical protein